MSIHEGSTPTGPFEDIVFSSFRLDRRGGRLLHGGENVALRPKTWAVLLYLAERPGALVTKEELLDAVWPDVAVTPDTLTKSIGELRVALGDDSRTPRCIETVHRRGFRFIAAGRDDPLAAAASVQWSAGEPGAAPFVGRAAELEQLRQLFARASSGERQVAMITGPAGVGKTTLVEAFLQSPEVLRSGRPVWIGRGACIEQHGSREPYMPVLDALGRLAKRPDAESLVGLLRRVAPTWLAQMPWLIGDEDHTALHSLQSARPERMLREFAALTEALREQVTLVLVLEDLHWSDPSTVDLLSVLAQRDEAARLLVLGTYRPAEVAVHEHVLSRAVRTLQVRRQCVEIPVHELDGTAVRAYLEARFPGATFVAALAPTLLEYTDGTPLFVVALVEHLLSRGWILETSPGWALTIAPQLSDLGVPDEARRVIETQFDILSPGDRGLLGAASVVGHEFALPLLAAAVPCALEDVEARCEALARTNRFLRAADDVEWPDGSVARRFTFAHELYRRAAHAEIPESARQRLHQRVGEALEHAYGPRAAEVAPELAAHFETARDDARAIRHLAAAAARARQRFASREAIDYLESAIARAVRLPSGGEGELRELELRLALAPALSDLHGFASEPLRRNFERARALCAEVGSPEQLFEVNFILCHLGSVRGNRAAVQEGLEQLEQLATRLQTREHRLALDSVRLRTALCEGRLRDACRTAERLPFATPPAPLAGAFGADPLIAAQAHYGVALCMRGSVGAGRKASQAALAAARAANSPFTLACATFFAALLEVLSRNTPAAEGLVEQAIEVSAEQGFSYWHALASWLRGWLRLQRGEAAEALAEVEAALESVESSGATILTSIMSAIVAEAHQRLGALAEARAAMQRAVALTDVDPLCAPEVWRCRGELLLAASKPTRKGRKLGEAASPEAEACLVRALEMARSRGAGLFELRAARSLARWRHACGRSAEAAEVLAPICRSFVGEPPSLDLVEANELLAAISRAL
jgi:DNA-binding winged helix-turn-helix (wHTH) protein